MSHAQQQLLPFDYAALGVEARLIAQQEAGSIRSLFRRAASDIIEIGQRLLRVREALPPGQWIGWLTHEFAWSDVTAARYMLVARRFGDVPPGVEFQAKALYLLAAPDVPEGARKEAVAAAATRTVTESDARAIVERHRERQAPLIPSLVVKSPPPADIKAIVARARAGLCPEALADLARAEERELLGRQARREEEEAEGDRREKLELGKTRIRQAAAAFRRLEADEVVRALEEAARLAEEVE